MPKKSKLTTRSGLTSLYFSVLLLSTNGLFARSINLDATSITVLRSMIAAAGILLLLLLQRRGLRLPNLKATIVTLSLGVCLGLHWITFFHSMQVSSVTVGIVSLFSYPVVTVLLEPCFGARTLQKRDIVAAILVFSGVAIMATAKDEQQGDLLTGVFWGVSSAILFALRNVSQKYWLHHIASGNIMLYQVCAVAVLFMAFADWHDIHSLDTHNWLLLIILGLACTAGAHTLLSISLKQLAAKSVALISCLQPFLASLLAWLVLSEAPSLQIVIGGVLVVSVAAYESLYK